jgi:uncharacterized protein (TIGR02145 family)
MKNLAAGILTVLLPWFSAAQTLTVHKTDQTSVSIPLSEIDSITFSSDTEPCPSAVSYAGRIYTTVLAGTQCWLRENLDVGTMVTGTQDQSDNGTMEKYCYNDSAANCDVYGGLYQWDEAMQYDTAQGTRGICPPGWHLPTLAELQTLSTTVGGNGNALKAVGQGTGGGAGTNSSGFSALLGGHRSYLGLFGFFGADMFLWSSTEVGSADAQILSLVDNSPGITLNNYYKTNGFSVRCLKD